MTTSSLFNDFLRELGVPHTDAYSRSQFEAMPFQSLFGLSKLLESYGIATSALSISDKTELTKLTPPFLADTPQGIVIVTDNSADKVTYLTQGEREQIPSSDFLKAWNGIVLLAFPSADSREPSYNSHHALEIIDRAKKWLLCLGVLALFAFLFITNGIWRHPSTVLLTIFNIGGLYLTYLLVQKTLKIKSKAADEVCGVLEKGGCDSILELKASSFFGIFKWSEVGFTYFSVSLLALLIFPDSIGALAICNACCLPFTVWSIWYQKFRARRWCTLCVSVQCTLWLLFFSYLFGGWFCSGIDIEHVIVLVVTYGTVLLAMNRLLPHFDKPLPQELEDNEIDTTSAA